MKREHFAVRDVDGLLAELTLHGCMSAEPGNLACAACRLEPAIDACSKSDGVAWTAYGLCKECRAAWPSEKVTSLVDRVLASGRLKVLEDDFADDDEAES